MTKDKEEVSKKLEENDKNCGNLMSDEVGEFKDIERAMNGLDTDESIDGSERKPEKMSKVTCN